VSTAYSNPYLKTVPEKVCNVGIPEKWYQQNLDDAVLQSSLGKALKMFPNTYSFAKNLAEGIVEDYSKKLPVSIVRPSIISSSWKEPFEGWINGINTVAGNL
jgi:fatty acyl-CoA reductase